MTHIQRNESTTMIQRLVLSLGTFISSKKSCSHMKEHETELNHKPRIKRESILNHKTADLRHESQKNKYFIIEKENNA